MPPKKSLNKKKRAVLISICVSFVAFSASLIEDANEVFGVCSDDTCLFSLKMRKKVKPAIMFSICTCLVCLSTQTTQ